MGEHVYLMVKPQKITLKTEECAKLTPQFCGPFEILYHVDPMAYQSLYLVMLNFIMYFMYHY